MLMEVSRERPAVLPADRATLLIEHAAELVTLGWSFGDGARGGLWQGDPGLIHDAAIAVGGDGRILAVGPSSRVRDVVDLAPKARIYDATGCAVVPGLIDACAEAVGPADASLQASGGGRRKKVRASSDPLTAALALSERDLIAAIWRRLDAELLAGTTGMVMTSGYGLDIDDELALLRAVQGVAEVGPLTVIGALRAGTTMPGARPVPPDQYVEMLTQDLIPETGEDDLATLFTLAADHSVLTLEQSWRVLRAAQTQGLQRRLEVSATSHPGVLDFADEMGVGSIVLLDAPSDNDIDRLSDSALTVVLPMGAEGLESWGKRCTQRLIALGVPVALGSGCGPLAAGPTTMLDAIRFACGRLGMTPAEALVASTVNAAFASGLGDDIGPLEPGKRADLLILNTASYSRLPFEVAEDPIRAVVKDGWIVVDQGTRVA
ncbi:MAG: amidohydrolase family protein [Chloroflexi bacterium]|nr:amidohydrolase family protein [Chloroflexota bacterium]